MKFGAIKSGLNIVHLLVRRLWMSNSDQNLLAPLAVAGTMIPGRKGQKCTLKIKNQEDGIKDLFCEKVGVKV